MERGPLVRLILSFVILIVAVVGGSLLSVRLWGGKPEEPASEAVLSVELTMTVAQFAESNNVPPEVVGRVFGPPDKVDRTTPLSETGMPEAQIRRKTQRALALWHEHSTKNWKKIPVKFALWFLFLATVFVLMRRNRVRRPARMALYAVAALLFGVALGSDPSPMGTVKDAIALYGSSGVIFPPRMVALAVFLVLVLLANKFICSWGCQFGVLQDLIFRLNYNAEEREPILPRFKPPFVVTNTIRVVFFVVFTAVAFLWATDLISYIDPFKVYHPAVVGAAGGVFIAAILIASLFVYRPWCHLFCPFGLVSWLVEKVSVFKIRVDYKSCIACGGCTRACPSTVMKAILQREHVIPDCFACGSCIEACPTDSITLSAGKREKPPAGKFR